MSKWSWHKWVLPSGWWYLPWMRCLRSLFKPSPSIIRLCRATMVKENCFAFQANTLNLIFLIEIISTSLILVRYLNFRNILDKSNINYSSAESVSCCFSFRIRNILHYKSLSGCKQNVKTSVIYNLIFVINCNVFKIILIVFDFVLVICNQLSMI